MSKMGKALRSAHPAQALLKRNERSMPHPFAFLLAKGWEAMAPNLKSVSSFTGTADSHLVAAEVFVVQALKPSAKLLG
jgi:hypothetical protein